MMTPFEHLKAKLKHAQGIDADAVRVDIEELASVLNEVEVARADGCEGCAFMDKEEWEMPCMKCKRACKDYWRAKA